MASFAKIEFCECWSKDKWFLGNAFSGVELRTKSKHFDYSNWSPISSSCSLLACLHFMDLGTRMYIIYISYTCSLYTTHLYKTKLPMINYILEQNVVYKSKESRKCWTWLLLNIYFRVCVDIFQCICKYVIQTSITSTYIATYLLNNVFCQRKTQFLHICNCAFNATFRANFARKSDKAKPIKRNCE